MVQSYQSISFYIKTVLQFFKQKIGINNWSHHTNCKRQTDVTFSNVPRTEV